MRLSNTAMKNYDYQRVALISGATADAFVLSYFKALSVTL